MRPSTARISQPYGQFPRPSGQPWIHVGDDYAGERGEEVVTIAVGTVLFAGPGELVPNYLADLLMLYRGSDASGNCVIVQHDGWVETFNHLEFYTVNTGDKVYRGWRVGGMGDSGNAYGVHLHHEVLTTPASPIPPFSRYNPSNQIEWEDKEAARIAALSVPATTSKGVLMALTDKEQDELLAKVRELHRDYAQGIDGVRHDGDSFNIIRRLAAKAGIVPNEATRAKKYGKK